MNPSFYLLYGVLVFISAFLFALLEIQIEGKDGWARKLPTWRVKLSFFRFLPGADKELTGYHTYLWSFLFVITHLPILYTRWSLSNELFLLSFFVLMLRLEDFLWFVLNPHFGLRKFKKEHIPWHPSWWGPLPSQYYFSLGLWCLLFFSALMLS